MKIRKTVSFVTENQKKIKYRKEMLKYHSNVTSQGKNSEKGEQIFIHGYENADLKVTAENDLLVKNLESHESCDKNVCAVEFGLHITYRCVFCFRMPWLPKMVFCFNKITTSNHCIMETIF